MATQNISSRHLAALLTVLSSFRREITISFVFSSSRGETENIQVFIFSSCSLRPEILFVLPKNIGNLSFSVVSRRREKTEICVFLLFRGDKDEQTKMIVISRQNMLNSEVKYSANKRGTNIRGIS